MKFIHAAADWEELKPGEPNCQQYHAIMSSASLSGLLSASLEARRPLPERFRLALEFRPLPSGTIARCVATENPHSPVCKVKLSAINFDGRQCDLAELPGGACDPAGCWDERDEQSRNARTLNWNQRQCTLAAKLCYRA